VLSCCVANATTSPVPVPTEDDEDPAEEEAADPSSEEPVEGDRSLDHNGKKQGPAVGRSRVRTIGPS